MDCSLSGSSVPGILQGILEWIATSASRGTQGLLHWQADYLPIAPPGKSLRPAAHQAPLSMGSSRQEHWSGLPFPSPYLSIESSNCFIIICPSKLDSSLMSSVGVASSLKPA